MTKSLTPAEFKLLDALEGVVGNEIPLCNLKPAKRAMARRMRHKGLLSKRSFANGSVRATQLGKRARLSSNI
jgi:hypothetical protein